jgi:tetratricopeptide (TPR) repeat protein
MLWFWSLFPEYQVFDLGGRLGRIRVYPKGEIMGRTTGQSVFAGLIALVVGMAGIFYGARVEAAVTSQDLERARNFRRQAMAAQNVGDLNQALLLYSRAAVFNPEDAVLYNDLGLVYQALKKYPQAKAAFQKAIELDQRYSAPYYNVGLLYKEQGQFDLAVFNFRRRVDMGDPLDPWTLKAQEALEEIYARLPALNRERIIEGAAEMEFYIARDKLFARDLAARQSVTDFNVAFMHGRDAFRNANYGWAVKHFEDALRINPESYEAKHALERARQQFSREAMGSALNETLANNRDNILDQYVVEAQSMFPESGQ